MRREIRWEKEVREGLLSGAPDAWLAHAGGKGNHGGLWGHQDVAAALWGRISAPGRLARGLGPEKREVSRVGTRDQVLREIRARGAGEEAGLRDAWHIGNEGSGGPSELRP